MTPQTPTLPPTEPAMWRRLLARAHPDTGGEHELFIWTQNVRDVVCDELAHIIPHYPTRSSAREAGARAYWDENKPRVPYSGVDNFDALTDRAIRMAQEVGAPYAQLLWILDSCGPVEDGSLYTQQSVGATYRTLAAIAHRVGMTKAQRSQWYRIAESIPLSQRHAGHIMSTLQERAA